MKRLILALSLMIGAQAQADVLFEPYLGYHMATISQTGSEDSKSTGVTLGTRLGYETMGFSVGGEFMTGMWKDDSDPKNDLTPQDLGVFVGYEFPILVRVYGGYVPKAKLKFKNSAGSNTVEGTAMKVGVGYTGFPVIAINLEMIKSSYDKIDGISLANKIEASGFGLTISAPLTF